MEFEAVIGLEIHIQLATKSKAFSSDSAEYGAMPNTQVSAISLGHPGTLPRHNVKAIELATRMGLALHCDIRRFNQYSRKNYFYADLPKGYQITQFDTPLCNGGFVNIKTTAGPKTIRLTRIHMEEDTGKSMHDQDMYDSLIDYNRAGTPLIEVVTEPDIRTGEEAYAFVSEIRRLVRHLDICDGNMEEGSLRCDANVSIRPVGSTAFGTKVEVKNMNSISNVKRAIDFEIQRQSEIVRNGGNVEGETRGFNGLQGSTTFSMRKKEMVNDYRYFPEPDLPPLIITDEFLNTVKNQMPELPESLMARFTGEYGLSEYDAGVLVDDKSTALYFEQLAGISRNYKAASNWVTVNIRGYLNEQGIDMAEFPLSASQMAEMMHEVEKGTLSHSQAAQKLLPAMIENPQVPVSELIEKLGLAQTSDENFIIDIAKEVVNRFPDKVAEYKAGKTGLLGMFVGELMKQSKGKADPRKANEIVKNLLDTKGEI